MVSMRRSRGAVRSPPPATASSRRGRALITSCIVLIAALAWVYLLRLNHHTSFSGEADTVMARMGMVTNRPWGARDLFFTFVMWSVMMVGMMAAAALPVLLLFAGARVHRAERGTAPAVLLFGLGYVAVWLGFSACATGAQWALHQGALLSSTLAASSSRAAGAILIVAGTYQLTPLKGACLAHCRSPLGFLMSNWRDGSGGAFLMGWRHGAFCLGCCWALMGVLFVVGVMNLVWVAALAVFIFLEKVGPGGLRVARAAGAALIATGMVLLWR